MFYRSIGSFFFVAEAFRDEKLSGRIRQHMREFAAPAGEGFAHPPAGKEPRPNTKSGRIAERNLCATIPGERVFKDLGVAKRYCRINVIGNTVLQC